jgi:hypothetical protein
MSYNYTIRKTAQLSNQEPPKGSPPSYWMKLKGELIKLPNLKSEVRDILNSADKIVFDAQRPSDKTDAIAYVSSADKNNNGKIDKIHFVLPNMPQSVPDNQFTQFLSQMAGVLMHEEAHIEDFDPNKEVFNHGEDIAEMAGDAAERAAASALASQLPTDVKLAYYRGLLSKMAKEFNSAKVGKITR